ncbi:MAG: elongation factor P maturation arginine rhamnosyltransferase EarP [Betaproteobacteria bacterium]|nr:elongation factor P maturation arginine rhamnosyltransferase EarP [Betaproteobacteria bacterium]
MRWDLFCAVVDNLGDIGVCWRLARQLAAEHAADVRLWVDDLATFRRLAPMLDADATVQRLGDIEVHAWKMPYPPAEPADIVVETFGCELPAAYVEAMAKRARASVWINLEYLSAESWVDGCHGLPSPHPRLPLIKYFFFPGFTANTGGVLIERGLSQRRQTFQRDTARMRQFLDGLGVRAETQGEILVSLFCYPHAPLMALLEAWAAGSQPIRAISFGGTPGAQALGAFGLGGGRRRGALAGEILPFLAEDDYDRVLWACDWNFVRGEDSFVRAQLAARPLVWQAYPQAGNAHGIKLQVFLDRYSGSGDLPRSLDPLWRSWNGLTPVQGLPGAWAECMENRGRFETAAGQWPAHLEALGDLAGNLAQFCAERV